MRGATVIHSILGGLRGISIHAPREGSDLTIRDGFHLLAIFQSTLPVRGATVIVVFKCVDLVISIHAPREGSDDMAEEIARIVGISIHAPREGSDDFCH